MKKKYTTPKISIERFGLTQSIAACATGAKDIVEGLNVGTSGVFTGAAARYGLNECTKDWEDLSNGDDYQGYCYWKGSNALFMSR